jgi:hypothetical protein
MLEPYDILVAILRKPPNLTDGMLRLRWIADSGSIITRSRVPACLFFTTFHIVAVSPGLNQATIPDSS